MNWHQKNQVQALAHIFTAQAPVCNTNISGLQAKWLSAISILILGVSMSACSNSTSWKEEVLLHDSKKIIVERTTTRDSEGRREIGQHAPIIEQTLTFTPPDASQSITWKSDFGQTFQDNLDLLAIDIVDSKPYVVAYPGFCHAYNKWGRPNPPYVVFRFDRGTWQRISMDALPKEIVGANVIIGSYDDKVAKLSGLGIDAKQTKPHVPAEIVARINRDMGNESSDLRMRVFVREPIKGVGVGCLNPATDSSKSPVYIPPPSQAHDQK